MPARFYMPLVTFIVPTVVIGYGVVIPRSCIAGLNELTIGFGVTLASAVATYVLGVRMALKSNRAPFDSNAERLS